MRNPLTCAHCGYRIGDIISDEKAGVIFQVRVFGGGANRAPGSTNIVCPCCNFCVAEIVIADNEFGGDEPPEGYEFGMKGGEKDGE